MWFVNSTFDLGFCCSSLDAESAFGTAPVTSGTIIIICICIISHHDYHHDYHCS
jgi:hypothetical protein